jgi:putative transcriptional regulator
VTHIRLFLAACLALAGFDAPAAADGDSAGAAPKAAAIFLVAGAELMDPNFHQTVVLVARGEGVPGPIGVVINRPTEVELAQVLPDAKGIDKVRERVFLGGPVARNVLAFLFRSAEPRKNAIAVLDGVYLSFDAELLAQLLAREKPGEGLRVYAGHAGWAPGQLEAEVARGFWKSARPDARSIFEAKPESLWPEMSRRAAMTAVRLVPGSGGHTRR